MTKIKKFFHDNRGANLVEYIILVGVIAMFCLAGFKAFGAKVDEKVKEQTENVDGVGT